MNCPPFGGLNRQSIKMLAMLTMLANHAAQILMPAGTVLRQVLVDVGYFTAITMCYFLVEGVAYTRSKLRYALRLLGMAVLSPPVYVWALEHPQLNMLFTLFLCFLLVLVLQSSWPAFLKAGAWFVLGAVSLVCDWPLLAVVFTGLFVICKGPHRLLVVYASACLLFFWFNLLGVPLTPGYMLQAACSCTGIVLSGLVIGCLYNGQKGPSWPGSKWFFYWFYPGHLALLGLLHHLGWVIA